MLLKLFVTSELGNSRLCMQRAAGKHDRCQALRASSPPRRRNTAGFSKKLKPDPEHLNAQKSFAKQKPAKARTGRLHPANVGKSFCGPKRAVGYRNCRRFCLSLIRNTKLSKAHMSLFQAGQMTDEFADALKEAGGSADFFTTLTGEIKKLQVSGANSEP